MDERKGSAMSIKPPSDIVLDVARNADADMAATATRRLEALASSQATDLPSFGVTLQGVGSTTARQAEATLAGVKLPPRSQSTAHTGMARGKEVAQQFEATVLSAFINDAMPKSVSAYYGQGMAGDIWKSMLSDQIAHQLAKSGSLGLARRLFVKGPLSEAAGAGGVQASLEGVAQSSALPLSSPTSLSLSTGSAGLSSRRRS